MSGSGGGHDDERDYYLSTFVGKTIVIAAASRHATDECVQVAHELVAAGVGVTVVVPGAGAPVGDATVLDVWNTMRKGKVARLEAADVLAAAARVATAGRVHKLVLVDDDLPIRGVDGRRRSFVDVGRAGLPARLAQLARPLYEGVDGVNLCEPRGLAAELFTYSGSGTLLSLGDYGVLRPLGFDDYENATALLERGAALGYLRPRSRAQIEELLPRCWGFFAAGPSPAGVAALQTDAYAGTGLGEIQALFAISRFRSEGIGRRLLDALGDVARDGGLDGIFAVTTNPAATSFFEACGYVRVDPETLPRSKWDGYPSDRRSAVTALVHRL